MAKYENNWSKEEGRTGERKVKHSKYNPVTNPESSRSLRIPDFWTVGK